MKNHPDYATEDKYLQEVLDYINDTLPALAAQKDALDAKVDYAFKHMNIDNPEQYNEMTVSLSLLDAQKTKVAQMQYAQGKPYFARVDFTQKGKAENLYIGKMTLLQDLKMLITDWRAPMSSLYYEGRIGQASYDCIDGTIEGEITLKRQYQINMGQLEGFTDIDITTNDEFLQAALGASKDRRLGDIVSTIQAEQNKIIRAPLSKHLLVQGAAGSGKTTIALHRIAYLLYAHEDKLKANQVMIMAPSQFFLSYISDVLPDLGVNHVVQTTFADYVAQALEWDKWKIEPSLSALSEAINIGEYNSTRMEAARLKSGLNFHQAIENYCRYIEEQCIPDTDFIVGGYILFSRNTIKKLFHETYSYLPICKRGAEIDKYLKSILKKEIPIIIANIEYDYANRVAECKAAFPEDSPECLAMIQDIYSKRDLLVKRIKESSKTVRKQYMTVFRLKTVMTYYQELFAAPGMLAQLARGILSPADCQLLINECRFLGKKKALEPEDLPPLIWMHKRLYGIESDIKHVVIDEAQDLSIFQFIAIKAALPRATFSILGDLNQGILAHKGITNWGDLHPIFDTDPLMLQQSYRTTIEIMDTANGLIKHLKEDGPDVPLAVPVIRHGDPVETHIISNHQTLVDAVCKEISASQKAGFRSIAIIGKTVKECSVLQKALQNLNLPIITEQETPYEGGVLILPAYLAKGLEFDVVIVTDAAQYTQEALDIKLIYIAATRALHRLVIYSSCADALLL